MTDEERARKLVEEVLFLGGEATRVALVALFMAEFAAVREECVKIIDKLSPRDFLDYKEDPLWDGRHEYESSQITGAMIGLIKAKEAIGQQGMKNDP